VLPESGRSEVKDDSRSNAGTQGQEQIQRGILAEIVKFAP